MFSLSKISLIYEFQFDRRIFKVECTWIERSFYVLCQNILDIFKMIVVPFSLTPEKRGILNSSFIVCFYYKSMHTFETDEPVSINGFRL